MTDIGSSGDPSILMPTEVRDSREIPGDGVEMIFRETPLAKSPITNHKSQSSHIEERCTVGGGPSREQKQAAASQANLTNELANVANRQQDFFEKQQNAVNPFYTSRMQNGLPYFNPLSDASSGLTAQAFAPARQPTSR